MIDRSCPPVVSHLRAALSTHDGKRQTAIQQGSTSTSVLLLASLSLPDAHLLQALHLHARCRIGTDHAPICPRPLTVVDEEGARTCASAHYHASTHLHPKACTLVHLPSPSPVDRLRLHCGTHDAGGPLLRPSTPRTPLTELFGGSSRRTEASTLLDKVAASSRANNLAGTLSRPTPRDRRSRLTPLRRPGPSAPSPSPPGLSLLHSPAAASRNAPPPAWASA